MQPYICPIELCKQWLSYSRMLINKSIEYLRNINFQLPKTNCNPKTKLYLIQFSRNRFVEKSFTFGEIPTYVHTYICMIQPSQSLT